jgi:hypothetical protein
MWRKPRSRIGRRPSAISSGVPEEVPRLVELLAGRRHPPPVGGHRGVAGVADDEVDGRRSLDLVRVPPDGGAVLAQDAVAFHQLIRQAVHVPLVAVPRQRPERLLRAGAPIMIGRCAWTGRGATSASRIGYNRPVVRTRSSPSSRRRISITDSSSRSSRSPNPLPKSIPYASCSRSNHAPPMPRIARPPTGGRGSSPASR